MNDEDRALSHLDASGDARMADVSSKPVTARAARAACEVLVSPATALLVEGGDLPKGDVLTVARIAGVSAAKRTAELIPLCHVLPLDAVDVRIEVDAPAGRITVEASARATARTGVEMEALTAASVAALTVYDMVKAVERGARINDLRLLEKSGGASGHWRG